MEHYIVISAIIGVFIIFATIIVVIIFACTKSRREYGRIKNMAESEGTITGIKFIEPHPDGGYEHYVISYSFTDIYGKSYSKSFENQRLNGFKKGDKITVYYDVDNPNKCVTDYKLKADKNKWWQALIIAAIIIIVPFIISFAIYND